MPTAKQLPPDVKIAGDKTVQDWVELKAKIIKDFSNIDLWSQAYKDFYYNRLQIRYLGPVGKVLESDGREGEGFAMMAVMCSIIEFLESTHQGKNYQYSKRNLGIYEYGSSKQIIEDFLNKRPPFNSEFHDSLATDFYKHVRCSLLHEGRTSGRWVLKANSRSSQILEQKGGDIELNRTAFFEGIKNYVSAHYKQELQNNNDVKNALIRKLDFICCE